ncbi:uncharacterized protein si:dkey-20d21.12 [Megalops cyprinoides]|uniref:uncharacterized protein si:dkey-20d21.12 n=1 Tax=Megalops cyprinoides TaxID=118141 RepID=UPI001863B9D3|nr:uncharacterized protein si:dkey-20d21.12 [Megalops cyprinoides]
MIKNSPSPAPVFIRISDRDLTEIELHSVESINDLHRTHTEQPPKGSRQPRPQAPSTNGNLQIHDMPVVYQTGYSMRRSWYRQLRGFCASTVCRYSWGCVAVTLMLLTLLLIIYFLVQQGSALHLLSQVVRDKEAANLEISLLIQELQDLRKNLTIIRGSKGD